MKEYYNRMWKDSNPFGKWTRENFAYHYKFFKPYVGKTILDYGCGSGQFLNMLTEKGYGVDLSDVAIDKARRTYPNHIFNTTFDSFSQGQFDTICLIDVLEHIPDLVTVLLEIKRVLNPEGSLLIATNQLTRIKSLAISLLCFEDYFYPTSPHLRYFTKDSLKDVLQITGYKVIDYQKNRTYLGFIPRGQMVVARLR